MTTLMSLQVPYKQDNEVTQILEEKPGLGVSQY
jgi:hypothetical protein